MRITERKLRSIIRMVLKEAYDDDNNENNKNDDILKSIIKVLQKDIDFGPDFDYSFRLDIDRAGNEINYIETESGAGIYLPSSLRVDKETISKLRDCFDKNNESMAKQVVLNLAKNKITKNAKLKKTF